MNDDLHGQLQRWADRGHPRGAAALLEQVDAQMVNSDQTPVVTLEPVRARRGWAVAIAAAVLVALVVGLVALIDPFSTEQAPFVTQPPPVASTVPPLPTTITVPAPGASGLFDWEVYPLEGWVTYPAPFREGYVALLDGQVASSPDGVTWSLWPNQPVESPSPNNSWTSDEEPPQRALVVDDGEVLFIVQRPVALVEVHAAGPDRQWHQLAVEDLGVPTQPKGLPHSFLVSTSAEGLVVVRSHVWIRQGESFRAHPDPDSLVADLGWGVDVEPSWTALNLPLPEGVRAVGEKDGRFVAFGWPENGAQAWTSTDGQDWVPIDTVTVPYPGSDCGSNPSVISPEIVETGPLGWFAAGSLCAPGVVWYSPDGLIWDLVEGIEGMAEWDIFTAVPPVFLIEDQQVFIYGNNQPSRGNPAVWVGTLGLEVAESEG